MGEQRTPERLPERAKPERVLAEARPEADHASELPSRKGGYERMAAETLRPVEAAIQSATGAAAEEIGASVTRLVQETTDGLRAAMLLPVAPAAGLNEMQEAFTILVTGMMQNNIRLAQELMRLYGPQAHAALMQRCMRQWTDIALENQAALLRLARPAGEPPGATAPRSATH